MYEEEVLCVRPCAFLTEVREHIEGLDLCKHHPPHHRHHMYVSSSSTPLSYVSILLHTCGGETRRGRR